LFSDGNTNEFESDRNSEDAFEGNNHWVTGIAGTSKASEKADWTLADRNAEDETESESTASSVSSISGEEAEGHTEVDFASGKLVHHVRKRSGKESSLSDLSSTDAEYSLPDDEGQRDDGLPPPPPSPPLTPASPVSEEQKQDFRQKFNMLHEMALRSRKPGSKLTSDKPTFVTNTNL